MTTNEHSMTSFNETTQSQLCRGLIRLPTIFKGKRRSQLQCKLQFKTRQDKNIETNVRERTQDGQNSDLSDWLAKFTEFMQANGQPNAESSSAAYSRNASPSLHDQYTYVIHDQWQNAEPIYEIWPDLKTTALNYQGDTALHLAVTFNRTSFFNGLMNLMVPEELEVRNREGKTAFFMCTSLGNVEFAQTMLRINPGLAMITGNDSFFPIHMAVVSGHRQMVQLLCSVTVFDDLDFRLIVELFFSTLKNNIFDVGYALLEQCPSLAASRDGDKLTALHVLAKKPQGEFYEAIGSCGWGPLLIRRLWSAAKFMQRDAMMEFISTPSLIVFDAAKSGNIEALDLIFQSNPELLMEVDYHGRNLFHIAVLYRQENLFVHLIEKRILADLLMPQVDRMNNNILHFAGRLPPFERFGSSRPHIQMQRELLWFKEIENRVPTELKTMRNYDDDETPKDVFNKEHAKLHVEAGVAAKDTANYGMLVATIIATIVFAASLTVPGHDVSPNANSSILQKKGWYIIFILSNSIALFASSSSIFFFLSILTSSFAEDEFISSLQLRLTFGVTTLLVSITTMVVAFTAACFLIFNHPSAWVAYLVASLGFVTVALFIFLLYSLFGDLIRSLYWSRHLFRPANYYQRIKSHIIVFTSKMKGLTSKICCKLYKMSQITRAKRQEDNPVAEP